jgi:hypothetical protein
VPECPVHAIWPEDELPSVYTEWTAKNADLAKVGVQIPSDTDLEKLPGAIPLEEVQAREKSRGWAVVEPSDA